MAASNTQKSQKARTPRFAGGSYGFIGKRLGMRPSPLSNRFVDVAPVQSQSGKQHQALSASIPVARRSEEADTLTVSNRLAGSVGADNAMGPLVEKNNVDGSGTTAAGMGNATGTVSYGPAVNAAGVVEFQLDAGKTSLLSEQVERTQAFRDLALQYAMKIQQQAEAVGVKLSQGEVNSLAVQAAREHTAKRPRTAYHAGRMFAKPAPAPTAKSLPEWMLKLLFAKSMEMDANPNNQPRFSR